MLQIFRLTGIELAAENADQARKAKQCLIGLIQSHGITASQLIKLSQFTKENDDMFRTVMTTLNQGGDLKSIAIVPNRIYPLYLLTMLYFESGQTEKAVQMADRVLNFKEKVPSQAIIQMKDKVRKIVAEEANK